MEVEYAEYPEGFAGLIVHTHFRFVPDGSEKLNWMIPG